LALIAAVAVVSIPQFMGAKLYTILTKSMSPTYNIGDIVYVFHTEYDDVKLGDKITYFINSQGTVVTHRVIGKNEEKQEFVTKGDNNKKADICPVKYSNVIGVVKFHIPKIGVIIQPIASDGGKLAVSCAIGVCIILMNLISYLVKTGG